MRDDEDRGVHLRADLKAGKALPKQAGLSWPLPADRRLDQLVDLANEAGAATRRNELAAAIIAAADSEGEALLQLVVRWRRALVSDVVLDTVPESDVVYLPRYGRGRRKADEL
jgi:hypothetical protein